MVRKDRKKRIIMPSRNNTVLQSPETSDDGALDGGGFDDVVVTICAGRSGPLRSER